MNLFYKELNKSRHIYLTSALIIFPFIILYLSLYPLFYKHNLYFYNIAILLPDKIRIYFNIDLNTFSNFTTYYTFVFKLLSMLVTITTIFSGLRVFGCDYDDNINYLYALKPISKRKIIYIKIAANLVWLVLCFISFHLITTLLFLILRHNELSFLLLLQINSSLVLIGLVFLFLGMVIGFYLRSSKHAFFIALLTTFIFFVISIIDQTFDIYLLEYLNPLSYFQISDILEKGSYQYRFLFITIFLVFFLYHYISALYENDEMGGNNFD